MSRRSLETDVQRSTRLEKARLRQRSRRCGCILKAIGICLVCSGTYFRAAEPDDEYDARLEAQAKRQRQARFDRLDISLVILLIGWHIQLALLPRAAEDDDERRARQDMDRAYHEAERWVVCDIYVSIGIWLV